jgi:hypothetical protein
MEIRETCDRGQPRIGDAGVVKEQNLESGKPGKVSQTFVGNLGSIEA